VRISGWQVPPGYLRWSAAGLGILLLAIALTVIVSVLGLFGFATTAENAGTKVSATVSTPQPCNSASAYETVTFKRDGENRSAKLDGCGHAKGEPVDIILPPGPVVESMIVQSAGTAVGGSTPGQGLASVLLVGAGMAGAGFAFLVRRGPRDRALPRALRLVS
jgi:hypothetical protein